MDESEIVESEINEDEADPQPDLARSSQVVYMPDFYRLVANEAGFTIGDTEQVVKAVVKVIKRLLRANAELNLTGLGRFYVAKIKPHRKYLSLRQEYRDFGVTKRPMFKFSETVKWLLDEENIDKDIDID